MRRLVTSSARLRLPDTIRGSPRMKASLLVNRWTQVQTVHPRNNVRSEIHVQGVLAKCKSLFGSVFTVSIFAKAQYIRSEM